MEKIPGLSDLPSWHWGYVSGLGLSSWEIHHLQPPSALWDGGATSGGAMGLGGGIPAMVVVGSPRLRPWQALPGSAPPDGPTGTPSGWPAGLWPLGDAGSGRFRAG